MIVALPPLLHPERLFIAEPLPSLTISNSHGLACHPWRIYGIDLWAFRSVGACSWQFHPHVNEEEEKRSQNSEPLRQIFAVGNSQHNRAWATAGLVVISGWVALSRWRPHRFSPSATSQYPGDCGRCHTLLEALLDTPRSSASRKNSYSFNEGIPLSIFTKATIAALISERLYPDAAVRQRTCGNQPKTESQHAHRSRIAISRLQHCPSFYDLCYAHFFSILFMATSSC